MFRSRIEADYRRGETETRTDTYFLFPGRRDIMPKLRAGSRFEIKSLARQCGPLEAWQLDLSAPFPLRPEDLATARRVFRAAGALAPPIWSPDALRGALAPFSEIRVVDKARQLYWRGCLRAEITFVHAQSLSAWTLAFECEERDRLLDACDSLGLTDLSNLSYAQALRRKGLLA